MRASRSCYAASEAPGGGTRSSRSKFDLHRAADILDEVEDIAVDARRGLRAGSVPEQGDAPVDPIAGHEILEPVHLREMPPRGQRARCPFARTSFGASC